MSTETSEHRGIGYFFSTRLWELDHHDYRGVKRYLIKYLQIMTLVVRDFWADQCLLQASALAFTTILSLVPFLALAFAILKGLGVQNKLEPFILEEVSAGSEEVVENIITYINNTNMTSVGAIGLLFLLVTVITLMGNIEESFNVIWGVKETRSLYRKFSDYLSVLMSAPLLMIAAMSLSTSLQSKTLVQWIITNTYLGDVFLYAARFAQQFAVWAALVFLYVFLPNTKVHFKSALFGGVLAGTMWQVVQWGYIHFQVGVSKYNAIYGTLAVLPIFLVWIYTSWVIVLFGVEVVYAHQNIRTFRRELRVSVSHSLRELIALAILQHLASAFHLGKPAWTLEALAEELDVPVRLVRELLDVLHQSGYVVKTAEEHDGYQPGRDVRQILVKDVLNSLRTFGGEYKITRINRVEEMLVRVLAKVDACSAATLAGMTLMDLVDMVDEQSRKEEDPPAM